jgi:porin
VELQAQPLANPSGGLSQSGSWMQQLTLDLELGAGVEKPVAAWRGHLQLSLFSGQHDLSERIGAAFPLQSTAFASGLWLTEASVEHRPGAGAVGLKAGLFSINPDFVAAPVLDAYVHSALNDTLNLSVGGLPINPAIAPGLRLSWTPAPEDRWGSWQLGGFWLDPIEELARLFGVNPDLPAARGGAVLLQWRTSRLPGRALAAAPLAGPNGPVQRRLSPPLLQLGGGTVLKGEGSASGALAGTLTAFAPLPVGLDNRLWLGVNAGQERADNPVLLFLAGGWLSQGPLPGRPEDVLALAGGFSRFNPRVMAGGRGEGLLELNYSWRVNPWLNLKPVLQLILQPDGRSRPPILATGLGLTLRF